MWWKAVFIVCLLEAIGLFLWDRHAQRIEASPATAQDVPIYVQRPEPEKSQQASDMEQTCHNTTLSTGDTLMRCHTVQSTWVPVK